MSQRNDWVRIEATATRWLVRQAAARAPNALAQRLDEEWLADLESRHSAFARMRFALGCCWAVVIVRREYREHRVTEPVAASHGATALPDRNLRYFTLRPATLFLILGLHAAVFWGLTTLLPHFRL